MPEKNNLDWKTYEFITKYIYETLGKEAGVKVEGYGSNCKVQGKSGVEHQIDVLTSHSDGMHTYRTAIECKYWNDKINKDIVMKLSETIEDAGLNIGVIVSKSGFTDDGVKFAKVRNIRLVELRELEEKDKEVTPQTIELAYLTITSNISRIRPEILDATVECVDTTQNEKPNIYNTAIIIRLSNGNEIPFPNYAKAFRDELHSQNKFFQPMTKRYDVIGGSLIDKRANTSKEIKGIVFTGVLTKLDTNHVVGFTIVDQVWLIMKSIFEGKTFRISENGIIIKDV
jgi:hypothetical protein